ncbi:MAG: hypothetical protein GEV08_17640 [Acidimicrobiia bacterium]|nr:hypothetical protein [Acidimicrobiia bacterium]
MVEELQAQQVSTGEVQRVLQELLAEGVAVRDLVRILEAIGERARHSRDPDTLVEAVRTSLGPAISSGFATGGHLPAVTLEPLAEQALHAALRVGEQGPFLALGPDAVRTLVEQTTQAVDRVRNTGVEPVLVCGAAIRRSLRRLLVSAMANPPAVISYTEIGSHLEVDAVGIVSADDLVTA